MTSPIRKNMCVYFQVVVLCVSLTLVAPRTTEEIIAEARYIISLTNFLKTLKSIPQDFTACDIDRDVSSICYQCAKSHEEIFNDIYEACCSEENPETRSYCSDIYTEQPKGGRLWI